MPTMTMTLAVAQQINLAPLRVGRRIDIRIGKNLNRVEVIDIREGRR
jgi:Cu/Ag efflux protein CusF